MTGYCARGNFGSQFGTRYSFLSDRARKGWSIRDSEHIRAARTWKLALPLLTVKLSKTLMSHPSPTPDERSGAATEQTRTITLGLSKNLFQSAAWAAPFF